MTTIPCADTWCERPATAVIVCHTEWGTTSNLVCKQAADNAMGGFSCPWHGDDDDHSMEEVPLR